MFSISACVIFLDPLQHSSTAYAFAADSTNRFRWLPNVAIRRINPRIYQCSLPSIFRQCARIRRIQLEAFVTIERFQPHSSELLFGKAMSFLARGNPGPVECLVIVTSIPLLAIEHYDKRRQSQQPTDQASKLS